MRIDVLLSRLLLICIPLYFTQGWLFASGSTISQLLIGLWLIIDVYYVGVFFFSRYHSAILNAIIVFWFANLLYWFFSPQVVSANGFYYQTFGDFKNLSVVLLSYYPYYILSKRSVVDERYMKLFVLFFLSASIIAFGVERKATLSESGAIYTNNTAYYFLVILPLMGVFEDKKRYFWTGIVAILIFLLLCAKRGAIFCGGIAMLFYYILSLINVPIKKALPRVIALLALVFIVFYVVKSVYSSNELLQARYLDTKEGNLSERDFIYASLIRIFWSSSDLNMLFGYGMSQSVTLIGSYAHNDWLELLTDEGVAGVIMYAAFYLSLILYYHRSRKNMDDKSRFIYGAAFLCLFARSCFSMGYLAPESSVFCIALAYGQNSIKNKDV